jgi:hypothetical protein
MLFLLGVAPDIMLLVALFILLLGALFVALETRVVDQHMQPNGSIYRSAKSGLVGGLAGGLGFGLLGILYGMLHGALGEAFIFVLIFALVFWFQYGGAAVLKHYILRLLLCLSGAFPLNIAAFLDSCAQRQLVYRIGGGWRFPHNLIRDYFAELEIENKGHEITGKSSTL